MKFADGSKYYFCKQIKDADMQHLFAKDADSDIDGFDEITYG